MLIKKVARLKFFNWKLCGRELIFQKSLCYNSKFCLKSDSICLTINRFTSHTFEIEFNIPAEWENEEIRLVWESGCESQLIVDNKYLFGFSTCEDDGLHKSFCVSECFQAEKYNQVPGCFVSADNKIRLYIFYNLN